MEIGVTHGEPDPTIVFNIVVYTVVRAVMLDVCGLQEAQHGLGYAAGEHKIFFYADDGHIAGRNPIEVQKTLPVVVCMFDTVVL